MLKSAKKQNDMQTDKKPLKRADTWLIFTLTVNIMSKLFLICVLACVAMAAAKPRVLPLKKAVPQCGTTELIACSGEIESKFHTASTLF